MSYYAIDRTNELAHHGILGMKWGVRRYQNEDGSLTSAGRIRYYGAGGDRKGYYKEIGAAKRYKDAQKVAYRKAHARAGGLGVLMTSGYRNWRKQSSNNRGLANYAKSRIDSDIRSQFGNSKDYANAKYAYEHKNLAKYQNRDGSLTVRGKLKYWDTNKARGEARRQKDIARDKARGTTSERELAKVSKMNAWQIYNNPRKYYGKNSSLMKDLNDQARIETKTVNAVRSTKNKVKSDYSNAKGSGVKKYANFVADTNKRTLKKMGKRAQRRYDRIMGD